MYGIQQRTRCHLAGPSAIIEVRNRIRVNREDQCWIDQREVKKVNDSIVSNLREGLRLARVDVADRQTRCLGGLEDADVRTILRGVSTLSNVVRDRVIESLNVKKG